jgi:hypothetical protein
MVMTSGVGGGNGGGAVATWVSAVGAVGVGVC